MILFNAEQLLAKVSTLRQVHSAHRGLTVNVTIRQWRRHRHHRSSNSFPANDNEVMRSIRNHIIKYRLPFFFFSPHYPMSVSFLISIAPSPHQHRPLPHRIQHFKFVSNLKSEMNRRRTHSLHSRTHPLVGTERNGVEHTQTKTENEIGKKCRANVYAIRLFLSLAISICALCCVCVSHVMSCVCVNRDILHVCNFPNTSIRQNPQIISLSSLLFFFIALVCVVTINSITRVPALSCVQ